MQPINPINGSWKQGVEPKVVNLTGTAFMEEAGAHVFHITAEDASGAAMAFTGTVSALFLRADNTTVAIDGEISGGAAEVTLVSDCYHAPGRFSIAIYVSNGTDSTCVYAAVGNVYRTSSDVVIDSGATIPTLAQLQAAYQACVEATADAEGAAEEAIGNFAPAFAEATANAAGSYVTYTDGKMYLLPNGHTANTTWANTTKSEVKVGGELTDLRGAFLLESDEIQDTTQSITFGSSGNVSQIVHKDGSNNAVRTDVFTFGTDTITEVRTLSTGESLTIVTNTDTLVTTVTYADAA